MKKPSKIELADFAIIKIQNNDCGDTCDGCGYKPCCPYHVNVEQMLLDDYNDNLLKEYLKDIGSI